MTMSPKGRLKIERELQEIQNERTNLRARDRSLSARARTMNSQPLISDRGSLRSNLQKIVPKHLMPKNIGQFNEVFWDYVFPFDFDFGVDPDFTSLTRQNQTVQIDQEAGFLLTHISRSSTDPGQSGMDAPLQLSVKDLQSSRQYNSEPIPLQQIGYKGQPTFLDTPLYFSANARIEIEMTSWIPEGLTFDTTGNGKQQIVLGGFRVREKDGSKVIASMFL